MEGKLRFKIDWASLIVGRKFTIFALFYFVFEGNFKYKPPGGLYLEGRFNGGVFALRVWGASIYIHALLLPPQRGFSEFGGAYTWRGLFRNFIVV